MRGRRLKLKFFLEDNGLFLVCLFLALVSFGVLIARYFNANG